MNATFRSSLAAIFVLAASGVAHAQMPLTGAGPVWPATGTNVNANWSSDFGVDYSAHPNGTVIGNGAVTPGPWWGSDPWGYLAPNQSYSAWVERQGILGGFARSEIGVQVGSYGAIGPLNVQRFSIDLDLANPSACCGVGVDGTVNMRYDFDKGSFTSSNPATQYWVAEWTAEVVNPGTSYFLDFGASFMGQSLLPSASPATGTYHGIMTGSGTLPWLDSFCFGGDCDRAYWTFIASGSLGGGGMLGAASLDIDIALAFSGTPIDRITPPITTPIPEPQTYAMLLAGLGLLGFAARRRKRLAAAA